VEQCPSPNIIRMIKTERMRWAEHVARMGGGKKKVHRGFSNGNLRGKRNLLRPESRWADDNDLQEKGRQGVGSLIWLRTGTWRASVDTLMDRRVTKRTGELRN
jgi:hypothetical protein